MTDQQLEVHVTPMVMVVTTDGEKTAAFSDLALEGDDAATISDGDLKVRAARWFDLPAGALANHAVERRSTGNIIIMPRGEQHLHHCLFSPAYWGFQGAGIRRIAVPQSGLSVRNQHQDIRAWHVHIPL